MPEDSKLLSKPSKFQLQFHCRIALISNDQRAGSELSSCQERAHRSEVLLPSSFNKPLSSAHHERGHNHETSTLALLGSRMPPVRMGRGNSRAEPRTMLPSRQLLLLALELFPQTPPVCPNFSKSQKRIWPWILASEEKQKKMKFCHRGLSNRLHRLGCALPKYWVQGQQLITLMAVMGRGQ